MGRIVGVKFSFTLDRINHFIHTCATLKFFDDTYTSSYKYFNRRIKFAPELLFVALCNEHY
jgi:hypothetical protein